VAEIFRRSPKTVAVFSDAQLIDPQSRYLRGRLWDTFFFGRKEQKRFANGHAFNVLLKHPVVTGATMAFRQEFRPLLLPIPAPYAHDYWISILLSACGDFRPIPDALIQYRQHANQKLGAGPGRFTLKERTQSALKDARQSYLVDVKCFTDICRRLDTRNGFVQNDTALKLINEKISHRSTRAGLPESRFLRLPTIFREVANRGYWHYSEGWKSVARDIFL
jgi:hypothetical protein